MSDAAVFIYAVKKSLITEHCTMRNTDSYTMYINRVVTCILNAGISKGTFIVGATLYDAKHKVVVEYAAIGEDLIDALYNLTNPETRKEYNTVK